MKKILVLVLASALALTFGCGRKGTAASSGDQRQAQQTHDHSGCSHDHGGSHEGHSHEAHNHDGHGHAPGESCGNGKAHAHDTHAEHAHGEACTHDHAGHDHDAHAGHDHSPKSNKKSKSATDPHAGHDHGSEGGEAVDPDEIVFPAAQAARTDFEVLPARRGMFREVIKCGGSISAAQAALTVVPAPIAGIVTPYDGRIMASTPVRKGQELFNLSSGGLASGDAVAKARINYEQAKANFERVKNLYSEKLLTQRDYLEAESQYLTAEAEYAPVRRSDGRGGTVITSPADGYIAEMAVSAGDYVEMGAPLATIARSGRMQLRALVSQRYFDRLPQIADANFRTPATGEYHNVAALGGSLYSAGRIVSAGSSLIPVVFEFDGGGALPDGAYVDVALLGRQRDGVLTLPLTAITEQQGLYYVYVQLDEECYSRREVTLGPDDGIRVEILSGIDENEPVVTRGAVNVKMASASGAIPHGHSH